MTDGEIKEISNFIKEFGCVSLKQLQILFNKPKNNFKEILKTGYVNKKGDIFVYFNEEIDMLMIYALDVLCEYNGRATKYYKGIEPVKVEFFTNENLVYYIVISDNENAKGLVKRINSDSSEIYNADRIIFLFENNEYFDKIECQKEYIYCIYKPELQILTKKTVEIEIEDDGTEPDIEAITKEYLMKNRN